MRRKKFALLSWLKLANFRWRLLTPAVLELGRVWHYAEARALYLPLCAWTLAQTFLPVGISAPELSEVIKEQTFFLSLTVHHKNVGYAPTGSVCVFFLKAHRASVFVCVKGNVHGVAQLHDSVCRRSVNDLIVVIFCVT